MTVTILKGDCRYVLRSLPDESVHCVVTSPPYWGLRDYGIGSDAFGLESSYQLYVEHAVGIFRDVRRVLRSDGTCWINLGDRYAGGGNKPKDLCGIPWRVAFALQADGWRLRQDIIWSKPNPMPESVTDRCTKAHEYLFLLSKSERYYYDQEAILEEASANTHARLAQDVQNQIGSDRAHAGGKTNGNAAYEAGAEEHRTKSGLVNYAQRKLAEAGNGIKNNDSFDAAMAIMPLKRNKRSVWEIASAPFSEAHFATFPPALIEPCVLAGCPKGGTVLDPFGGAGTTGLVADRLGRNAILIELNSDYAAMAERRIKDDAGMFAAIMKAES